MNKRCNPTVEKTGICMKKKKEVAQVCDKKCGRRRWRGICKINTGPGKSGEICQEDYRSKKDEGGGKENREMNKLIVGGKKENKKQGLGLGGEEGGESGRSLLAALYIFSAIQAGARGRIQFPY